jgi:serine/threonine-protein kinase
MALILLVEQEGRYIERIQDALTAEGWQVKVVNQWAAAVRMAAAEGPDLLVVSPEVPGAEGLLSSLSRRNGGPGTIVLVPERDAARASTQLYGCDEIIIKPAVERDLKRAVRRMLASREPAQPPVPTDPSRSLSSQDIFGDMLRELENDARPARSEQPSAQKPVARPVETPSRTAESREVSRPADSPSPPRRSAESSAQLDRRLEETLSGLLRGSLLGRPAPPSAASPVSGAPADRTPSKGAARPAQTPAAGVPAAGAKSAGRVREDVDALLQRTLTDINWKPSKASTGISASFPTLTTPEGKPTAPPPPAATPPDKTTQRIPEMARFAVEGPKKFGPYTLVERIAVGGMAEVWKATRVGLEGFTKTVAIKRILSHLNDSPEFVTMLIDEAKLAALLEHPNITQIYDLGKIGDDHFIAMEYVEGKDLRAVLQAARARGETVPLGLALLIASRVAGALDYAHRLHDAGGRELRLVHRDVSPQNVLFGFAGQIKLCDFGIVKAVSNTNQTQMGALKGKLQYMSPEQAWGRAVDARSDVFSLGAVLFEMVSGRRLFAGSSEVSILESVRAGRTDRLADVVPTVSPQLDELVAKALQPLPEDRFQSAGEMQKAIDAAGQNLRPAPTEGELRDWVRGLFGLAPVDGAPAVESALVAPGVLPEVELEPLAEAQHLPVSQPQVAVLAPPRTARAMPAMAAKGAQPSWIWVAAGAALLAGALGIGIWMKGRQPASVPEAAPQAAIGSETSPRSTADATTSADETASPQPTTAAQPEGSPDLQRLVDEQFAQKERALREQYERERKRLEDEIARNRGASQTAADTAGAINSSSQAPAASAPVEATTAAVDAQPETPAPGAPQPPSVESAPPAVAVEAPAPVRVTPAQPATQRGDLVRAGPGVAAPSLVSRLEPRYPALARGRRVQATVTAEILVDENGAVLETRLRVDGPDVGFSDAVRDALRGARFRPATKDGVPVKMWKILSFPFRS